jgi:integrase/recombinase XerD
MTLDDAISAFLDHRRLAGRAAGTIALYRRSLAFWSAWREGRGLPDDLAAIGTDELRAFLVYLHDQHVPFGSGASSRPSTGRVGCAPATIAGYRRTLRALWRFLDSEGALTTAQARAFTRIAAPQVATDARPTIAPATRAALLAALGDGHDEQSARDRAIVLVLAESGMRIGELCSLTDGTMSQLEERRALIRGKGGRQRWVFWRAGAQVALLRYRLQRRPAMVDGRTLPDSSETPFFRGVSHRNHGGPVTTDLVRSLLKRVAADAGIALPPGAPLHAFRHAFAHEALDEGADISEVSQLLGHAAIETTMIYVRHRPDQLQEIYDRTFRTKRGGRRERRRDAAGHDG